MQSRKLGIALAVGALVAAVALFAVLRDDDSEEETTTAAATTQEATTGDEGDRDENGGGQGGGQPTEPEAATIMVRDGQPVGGVQELSFAKGEAIRFTVESDIAEEVHLHGYDIAKEVEAGGSVDFDVPATLEGVFEVELEHSVVPLAEITVTPG